MTRERDVGLVVVGAGPAGAAAAIRAADAGVEVLCCDKARFPRDKTCGDGVTAAALRHLETLGLDVPALPGYAAVRETVLVSPSGREISLALPDDGVYAAVVPRAELDRELAELARARGVEVRDGAGASRVSTERDGVVVELGDGTVLRAPYVVAADGHFSPVRRMLAAGAPPDLGTWHAFRQYFCGVDDPRLWVLFDADLLPGYAWVFPLPGGGANVGFGVRRDGRVNGKDLATKWRGVLDGARMRAILGPRAEPAGPRRAWPIPARFDPANLTHGRVLFAGDAAGVVDPLTGEGIAQAIETGIAAADAVARGGDAVAARYRRSVERTLRADLRLADGLSRVLANPWRAKATLRAVDASPWARRNFARWMFEDYPRALLATPRRWRRGMLHGPGAFRDTRSA